MSLPQGRTKESLEVRRARGEISCAECRRQKLKCSRTIPCTSCVRKGCRDVCPNGTVDTSQPMRKSQAGATNLAQTVKQMRERIQQLEDALQISHSSATGTGTPHPLLSDSHLKIKRLPVPSLQKNVDENSESADEDTIESYGTLALLDRGAEMYLGSDRFIIDLFDATLQKSTNELRTAGSSLVPRPSDGFPFIAIHLSSHEVQAQVEEKLPSLERATALAEAYLENMSWLIRIVDREQIMEELIPQIYKRRRLGGISQVDGTPVENPHALSLLLGVFACGAACDMTLPPLNDEANLYYRLAWTTISLKPVFEGASLYAVQAVALLSFYDFVSCRKASLESVTKMISLAMSLASSIGLHRDPTHFKFSPKLVNRRRRVFWELYSSDIWKSIGCGRPMGFHHSVIDCELPEDHEAIVTEDGTRIPSYWAIRHLYTKEVLSEVAETFSAARALKYSEILSLDEKIRDFKPEPFVHIAALSLRPEDGGIRALCTKFVMSLLKDTSLVMLHRNFFARALIENPSDPTKSRFAPSFLSAYRSVVTMLRGMNELLDCSPSFVARIWPIWAHCLVGSIMLGSIAAWGPESPLAPQAYLEFNLSINMLAKVQMHPTIKELLPTLEQLRDRAYRGLTDHGNTVPYFGVSPNPPSKEDEKTFHPVSGFGRAVKKGMTGAFGDQPRTLNDLLDRFNQPLFSASTTESPSNFSAHSDDGGMFASTANSHGSGQQTPTRSTSLATFPASDHISPSLQNNFAGMWINSSQEATAESATIFAKDTVQLDPSLSRPSAPFCNSGSSHIENTSNDTPGIQNTQNGAFQPLSPFDHDSLAASSTDVPFDMDFDISLNMRSSTGDESIVPLIPEDLSAWHTIFQDSRFFGNDAAMYDGENNGGPL